MNEVNHLAWIPIAFCLPQSGQPIYGAVACKVEEIDGAVLFTHWAEDFDMDEPLGAMTHWQPAS